MSQKLNVRDSTRSHIKSRPFAPILSIFSVLIFTSALVLIYFVYTDTFFFYHPLLMILSFNVLIPIAIYAERAYHAHWTHFVFQTCAYISSMFAFAVAFINKNLNGKPHLATWHSWFGIVVLTYNSIVLLLGLYYLFPLWHKNVSLDIRRQHHLGGTILLGLSWVTSFIGWWKIKPVREASAPIQFLYLGWVLIWGYFLLTPHGKKILRKYK